MTEHRTIGMLAYENAQVLDVVGPLEVFSRASRLLMDCGRVSEAPYRVEVISEFSGDIVVSSGLILKSDCTYKQVVGELDTLLISGGIGFRKAAENQDLLNWINLQSTRVRRLGSICTGSFLLSAAGLLRNRRATTHWAYCEELSRQAGPIDVDQDAIFVSDGRIYTSAGVTTGMDMALEMLEEDWGASVALNVAKELVLYQKRPGEEHQVSRQLRAQMNDTSVISRLQEWIFNNLDGDLSLKALADRAAMSERHLSRRFFDETGITPGRYVDLVRVEAAQRRLRNGKTAIKQVARRCGFSSEESMRRAFHRLLGMSPTAFRTHRFDH